MDKPLLIQVNGPGPYDPVAGTQDYINPTLAGQDGYVFKIGYGPYDQDLYTLLPSGGFHNNYEFVPDEKFYWFGTGTVYASTSSGYTNGYNFAQVMTALFGRVGWSQYTISDAPALAFPNTISRSGRFFNDGSFHAIVSPVNVRAVQEDPDIEDADYNALLISMQNAAIMKALNGVFNVREYFEQVLVYDRLTRSQPVALNNSGLFVGYEINISQLFDLAVQIDSLQLTFDQDKTFTIYLFKDGKKSFIWSKSVSVVAGEQTLVEIDDLLLTYANGVTKGDTFYLGYFQSDLGTARAIQEQSYHFNNSRTFMARPIAAKVTGSVQIDITSRSISNLPYGINLEISSFRDHTRQIVKKANLFDELIGLSMAAMVLEQSVYAIRSNKNERILKEQIEKMAALLELNGAMPASDSPQIIGLKQRIDREARRVKSEFYPKPKAKVVNMLDDYFDPISNYYQ